jgi:hypothetical protein
VILLRILCNGVNFHDDSSDKPKVNMEYILHMASYVNEMSSNCLRISGCTEGKQGQKFHIAFGLSA